MTRPAPRPDAAPHRAGPAARAFARVVIHGETVWTGDSYAAALAAFRKSCKARGLRVPKIALVNE